MLPVAEVESIAELQITLDTAQAEHEKAILSVELGYLK